MRTEDVFLRAAIVLGALAAACNHDAGACAHAIGSGTYTPMIPDITASGKTVVVDRAAGVVTVSYAKDGKQVVEKWHFAQ
jgi:hypothetical protein